MGTTGSKGDVNSPPAPPPPVSPSTASPHKTTWAPVEIRKFEFQFNTPPANVDVDLAWANAVGCSKGPDGSQGVIFVQLAEGAVVLKGSNSLASEVFATSVARALGIPGPRMRVIAMRSPEGQAIKAMLTRLEPLLLYMVDMRYVLVMEYLVGFTLKNIDSTTFAQFTGVQENKVTILRQIGAVAALDALLNNSDRVPLVAQNAGNPGNLMFNRTNGHVISLDNSIVSLRGKTLENYAEHVASVLQPICANPSKQTGACSRIAAVIKQYTSLAIGDEGMINIQEGIAQCVVECVKLDMMTLLKTKQTLSRMDENVLGLELINEEFLEVMLLVFRHVQSSQDPLEYADILAEAKSNIAKRALDAELRYRHKKPTHHAEKAQVADKPQTEQPTQAAAEVATPKTGAKNDEKESETDESDETDTTDTENEDQKDSRTAQEMVAVNQHIGRVVDPQTYQDCIAIKGYGDAILLTRAFLTETKSDESKESGPLSPKDLKAQGKTLLEIARALVMVEREVKLQRSASTIQTALSDVTQQLSVFLTQAARGSGAVRLAAGFMGRRLLALLTVLQRHSTQKGASALATMVSSAMAELEFSYTHLRLACDGNALDSTSVMLMKTAGDLLQRRLLEFLNAAQDATGSRGRAVLRVECQNVFAAAKEASGLVGSLTPILLSKGHNNQLTIALGKISAALPAVLQAAQTASLRGSKLERLTTAVNELGSAAELVKTCVDCVERESTQTESADKRKALVASFRTTATSELCVQAETLARSIRR